MARAHLTVQFLDRRETEKFPAQFTIKDHSRPRGSRTCGLHVTDLVYTSSISRRVAADQTYRNTQLQCVERLHSDVPHTYLALHNVKLSLDLVRKKLAPPASKNRPHVLGHDVKVDATPSLPTEHLLGRPKGSEKKSTPVSLAAPTWVMWRTRSPRSSGTPRSRRGCARRVPPRPSTLSQCCRPWKNRRRGTWCGEAARTSRTACRQSQTYCLQPDKNST